MRRRLNLTFLALAMFLHYAHVLLAFSAPGTPEEQRTPFPHPYLDLIGRAQCTTRHSPILFVRPSQILPLLTPSHTILSAGRFFYMFFWEDVTPRTSFESVLISIQIICQSLLLLISYYAVQKYDTKNQKKYYNIAFIPS